MHVRRTWVRYQFQCMSYEAQQIVLPLKLYEIGKLLGTFARRGDITIIKAMILWIKACKCK